MSLDEDCSENCLKFISKIKLARDIMIRDYVQFAVFFSTLSI